MTAPRRKVTLGLPAQSRAGQDDDVYPRGLENFPIKDHLEPAPQPAGLPIFCCCPI
jgi:hypothetical protein